MQVLFKEQVKKERGEGGKEKESGRGEKTKKGRKRKREKERKRGWSRHTKLESSWPNQGRPPCIQYFDTRGYYILL